MIFFFLKNSNAIINDFIQGKKKKIIRFFFSLVSFESFKSKSVPNVNDRIEKQMSNQKSSKSRSSSPFSFSTSSSSIERRSSTTTAEMSSPTTKRTFPKPIVPKSIDSGDFCLPNESEWPRFLKEALRKRKETDRSDSMNLSRRIPSRFSK